MKALVFPDNLTVQMSSHFKANEQIHQENLGENHITHSFENPLQAKL